MSEVQAPGRPSLRARLVRHVLLPLALTWLIGTSLTVWVAYYFAQKAFDRALLDRLLDEACRPPRVYRHRWSVGDLVLWDNRCMLHRGRPWDMRQARVMRRTTVAGDAPPGERNEWALAD